jgi:uncharacterized membrane-anchored protein
MKQWILLIVAAGQLAVPATMILQREHTLRDGHAYKFRTQPVDPYDAFRGRYVALRLEPNTVPGTNFEAGATVYVTLAEGSDGFVKFTGVSRERPVGQDYLKVKTGWSNSVRLPFDRFYMEEKAAPAAERAYREHSRQGGARDAYVIVRVRDGSGVIENLYVAGQPIAEFARAH